MSPLDIFKRAGWIASLLLVRAQEVAVLERQYYARAGRDADAQRAPFLQQSRPRARRQAREMKACVMTIALESHFNWQSEVL